MAFTEKKIRTTMTLANGSFEGGNNQVTIEGLRASCQISTTGDVSSSAMSMAIYGLPMDLMNQLSNVGVLWQANYFNQITVEAGDDDGMSVVFAGQINTAYFDGSSMPETCFRIAASTTTYWFQKPAPNTSTTAKTDVATTLSGLAKGMGLAFENAGVNAILGARYYSGSYWQQISDIAKDAGIEYCIERGTLVITKPGTPRSGDPVLISPQTGLIGYPRFNQAFILIEALFNPNVKYQGPVKIESSLKPACGTFTVNKLDYQLEALVPQGKWSMFLECYAPSATAGGVSP